VAHPSRVVQDPQDLDQVSISVMTDPEHQEMPASASAAGDRKREEPAVDIVARLCAGDGRALGQSRDR
jgi:hypothetical protein